MASAGLAKCVIPLMSQMLSRFQSIPASPTRRLCMDNKINFAGKLLSNPLSDTSEYQEDSDNDVEEDEDDVYIDQNFTDVSTNEMFAPQARYNPHCR